MDFVSKLPKCRRNVPKRGWSRGMVYLSQLYVIMDPSTGQSEGTIQTLEDMLRAVQSTLEQVGVNHFALVEFLYIKQFNDASIKAAPLKPLYGQSVVHPVCWAEVGQVQLTSPDLVRETTEKIVGDKIICIKVSPWKGVVRFGKRGKLNPRYVGPFKVLEKVGEVAYKLELLEELSRIQSCQIRMNWGLHTRRFPAHLRVTYLELPGMPEDPYVEAALQAPLSLDYVPGPMEPEQAPPSPDYSPDYVLESDPEADPEEDDDEDPEEDPVDYPVDGGDDGDDEDELSEEDEDDDVNIETDEDEEEEEHPAPADSVVVALPTTDQAPFAEETEPFETDKSAATPPPHPAYRVIDRISILAPVPTPVWSDAEVARLLAISTPPSSPLSPWSSPLPQIPSPPLPSIPSPSLPVSPPLPVSSPVPVLSPSPPPSPIRSLGYRAAMIRLRAEAASTSHSLPLPPPFILSPTRSDAPSSGIPPPLPISVPTSSPPLLLPSASRREDRPEVTLPPRKRLGIALGPRYEVGESSSAAAARPAGGLRADYGFVATMDREIRRDPERDVGYGITDSWDEIVETLQGAPVSTDTELGRHMTAFETRVRQDTDEIYTRLDDEQSQRQLLAGRLNMLFRDRRAHAYTRHLMETEARLSREAWRRSMDASDLAHREVMSLRTTVLGQMSEIRELHAADRRRQAVTSEMLKADHRRSAEMRELRTADRTRQQQLIQTLTVMQSLQGQVTTLQGQVTALQGQVTALQGQQGPAGITGNSRLVWL
ncbi:hypothetical protein Tco_0382786 [Tanacetum coccineum]